MEDGERTAAAVGEAGDRVESGAPAPPGAAHGGAMQPSDRRAALTEMMQAHGNAVRGFCLRVVRDRALADDVTQQVFLEAYRDLEGFQGRSSSRSWLFSIASHRCVDALRT